MSGLITSEEMREHRVRICEPFSEFLGGDVDEHHFEISLLDVVRFAGHACPAMVGAFLVSRAAIHALYPESGVCSRGDVVIEIPSGLGDGATGPISNVFSFVFGAWGESGFGGLQGRFRRRGLLQYSVEGVALGKTRFRRVSTNTSLELGLDLSSLNPPQDLAGEFQRRWRWTITQMVRHPEQVIA